MSGLERERANIIRDILVLPERDRVEILRAVDQDLAAGAKASPIAEVAEQMANALETFDKVADHLGYDSDIAKLMMKIREFDSAPDSIREGVQLVRSPRSSTDRGRWQRLSP